MVGKKYMNSLNDKKLIEQMAHIEHERWSSWMRYLFTKGKKNLNGVFVINKDSVKRWERQMNTKYKNLSEGEKESDRIEVKKTLLSIKKYLKKRKNNANI